MFIILVPYNITARKGSLVEIINKFFLIESQVVESRHLISLDPEVGKLLGDVFEIIISLFGCAIHKK